MFRTSRPFAAAAVVVLICAAVISLVMIGDDSPDLNTTERLTTGQSAADVPNANVPLTDEVQGFVTLPSDPEIVDQIVPDANASVLTDQASDARSELAPPAARAVEWSDGLAARLACNQLVGTDFSTGSLPVDYYESPAGRERVITQGGIDNSGALEVGIPDGDGQFAEIVPVTGGASYWFRGWFERQGEIDIAEMGIILLDRNYERLNLTVAQSVAADIAGFHEVELTNVPAEAAFALPFVFKDASPGVLIADELVFGHAASCFGELSAGAG